MGKGFSVVDNEVRELADSSRQSSSAIGDIMTNIMQLLAAVKEKNSRNLVFVEGGKNCGGNKKPADGNCGSGKQLQAGCRSGREADRFECGISTGTEYDVMV